jgi:hypothetical protein
MKTEDLNACFSDIGSLLLWERDPNRKGRVLVKVRVTDSQDIPRSIRLTESSRPEAESWTFLVEVLQQNLLGGGPPDEDPLPDEGVDPHPMPGHALPAPLFNQGLPPQNNQINEEAADGWGHWAMGPQQEQPQPMEVEMQEQNNNFMPEAQEEVNLGEEEPPLPDVTSMVQVSSSSSEDSTSHYPVSKAASMVTVASGSSQSGALQPALPLGEGLLSLMQAYSTETDPLEGSSFPNSSMDSDAIQTLDTMADNLFLPDNVNMVPPNEAHLQLTLGRVETHFFSIPEEHNLARKLSPEGFLLWEKYFAPYMHGTDKQNHSAVVDIPVSWFNFITLMLLTPEKFD